MVSSKSEVLTEASRSGFLPFKELNQRVKMYRLVPLLILFFAPGICLAQYGLSPVESMSQSLDDIATQLRFNSHDRTQRQDANENLGLQNIQLRQAVANLNQQIVVAVQHGQKAIALLHKSEQHHEKLVKKQRQLEEEVRTLKRDLRVQAAKVELLDDLVSDYSDMIKAITDDMYLAVSSNKPDLILGFVSQCWKMRTGELMPKDRLSVAVDTSKE